MKRLAGLLMLAAAGLAHGADGTVRDAALERDIAYWTAGYDGAGVDTCAAPDVPALSRANQEIRAVGRAITAWQRCHDGLQARLGVPASLDERVAPVTLAAMTGAEREAAQRHVDAIHARLLAAAQAAAPETMARHDAWLAATADYTHAQNAGEKASRQLVKRNQDSARKFRETENHERRLAVQGIRY